MVARLWVLVTLLVLALMLPAAAQQVEPGSPSSGPPNTQGAPVPGPEKAEPKQQQQNAATNPAVQHGANQTPDHQPGGGDRGSGSDGNNSAHKGAHQPEETTAEYTVYLVFATIALVIATITLAVATIGLYQQTRKLAEEAVKQGEKTEKQLEFARQSFSVDQRSWLSIQLEILGNLDMGESTASVHVGARIRNIGKTPAKFIHTVMKMDCGIRFDRMQEALDDMASSQLYRPERYVKSLLPNEEYLREWAVIDSDIKKKIDQNNYIIPDILVCVTYETIFNDGFHQTAAVYFLGEKPEDYQDNDREDYTPIDFSSVGLDASSISVSRSDGSILT